MRDHKFILACDMCLLAGIISIQAANCSLQNDIEDSEQDVFRGQWVEGKDDSELLLLIDQAFECMQPSSQMANLALLYKRDWDGFVEAKNWPCWWIQNSFGPSYGMMPLLKEPYATWLKHSQALWFRLMGDGERENHRGDVAPDGNLCDAAGVFLNGGEELGFGDPRTKGSYSGPVLEG